MGGGGGSSSPEWQEPSPEAKETLHEYAEWQKEEAERQYGRQRSELSQVMINRGLDTSSAMEAAEYELARAHERNIGEIEHRERQALRNVSFPYMEQKPDYLGTVLGAGANIAGMYGASTVLGLGATTSGGALPGGLTVPAFSGAGTGLGAGLGTAASYAAPAGVGYLGGSVVGGKTPYRQIGGTAAGAGSGALTGVAIGALGGPIGAGAGAIIGGIGGLLGSL
jgi:hypothetical protein